MKKKRGCIKWAIVTVVSLVALALIVVCPLAFLYTRLAFRHEKDPAQRERNREILRTMLSLPVLLGETIIIKARRQDGAETDASR